ncbi:MAG TPA: hypothetical protein VF857_04955, partial [Spirochaetota bacterium]
AQANVVYFYSEECSQCRYVKEKILPPIQKRFGDAVAVDSREVNSIDNFRLLLEMEKRSGKKINKRPPVIFIGDDVLEGKEEISIRLEEIVARQVQKGDSSAVTTNPSSDKNANDRIADEFKSLGIFAVVLGGLLDGINPCAFTTLIFLISYLSLIGRKGRDLVLSGAFYTLGVFAAYFSIGLGLYEFLRTIALFPLVGKVVSLFIAGAAVTLGAMSVYDFIKIRQGKIKEVKLQLGDFFKKKIHSSIRKGTRKSTIIIPSAGIGFLIGLFEFPCTGQVYFPIIMVIRGMSGYRVQGILYLLLYNILFVLPLVVVFALVYWGLTSHELAKIMQKRMSLVKLLTAFFFFAIAACLVLSVSLI